MLSSHGLEDGQSFRLWVLQSWLVVKDYMFIGYGYWGGDSQQGLVEERG